MSSLTFREQIKTAIADTSLQAALDGNAERRGKGREAAFASLPDWRERRQRAHAVRAEVIAHLDDYLEDFSVKVSGNGIHVHRATDATQALNLVLAIAQGPQSVGGGRRERATATAHPQGGKLFAKSKSMVSEEIELNRGLEARGHRVVETDLGEYIVQLRGEKPAHIITPAVHLRRNDVGRLFEKKLGLPYTDDIPVLTAAARSVLREVFLTANVGVSGVNFGVVETGTLCIVTNEGNGRMVTTLPPVHIALMGMERLVPRLDDLALMLSLLPRSATGQKLSVYTQLIHSPRRAGEEDGAPERHLIIVDNGRTRLRASGLQEALYCIRCGACLNACPVFREIGGHAYVGADGAPAPYPGPIGSVVSPGLLGIEQFGQLAQASSLCGACKDACPVDIDLPMLLTRVRAGGTPRNTRNVGIGLSPASRIGLQAYGVVGSSPVLFGAAQRLAGLGSLLVSPRSRWLRLPAFTGWGASKDLPRPAVKPFRHRWRSSRDRLVSRPDGDKPLSTGTLEPAKPQPTRSNTRPASGDVEPAALVDQFIGELVAVGGQAFRVPAFELSPRLIRFFEGRALETIMTWDPVEGVDLAELDAAGIRLVRNVDPTVKAGLTGCAAAISDTGTLVLPSGIGRPLTASLLPDIHVAIIHAWQIVPSLEAALRSEQIAASANAVLITGPSRTADIEMTLTIGVHGPKELIAYIVE
jgi:L-lactate dehydrogenase complex protein LldF